MYTRIIRYKKGYNSSSPLQNVDRNETTAVRRADGESFDDFDPPPPLEDNLPNKIRAITGMSPGR